MNIHKVRQHLNEIERLRVKRPSPVMGAEDIVEAIEYQKHCATEELGVEESPLTHASETGLSIFSASDFEPVQTSH